MSNTLTSETSKRLSDLSLKLLIGCTEKEHRIAAKYNLSLGEYKCIRQIAPDEVVTNTEIAKRMNLSSSRLTRIMDGLVEKGYIDRNIDPKDRRAMMILFTEKGKDFYKKLEADYTTVHNKILEDINPKLHEPLINALEKLTDAVNHWIAKKEDIISL